MQTDRLQADEVDFSVPQVGGWLLFLCAVLILVYPATVLYAVLANGVPKAIASHSAKRTLLLGVYCTVFTTLAMFSVSAGLKLWRVRPGAVRFAKGYLLAYLVTNAGYFLFWAVLLRPAQVGSLAEMGWYHVVRPIASVMLWYTYLEHSRRVRETFRDMSTVR